MIFNILFIALTFPGLKITISKFPHTSKFFKVVGNQALK